MQEKTIYRGDDTGFGGENLLTIKISNPLNVELEKAEFRVGCITKTFFPPLGDVIRVNLDAEETEKLKDINTGYIAVWDKNGKKRTAEGGVIIKTKNKVV